MRKRIFSVFLCLLLVTSLSGCSIAYSVVDEFYGNELVESEEAVIRVAFSRHTDINGEKDYMTKDRLCEITPESSLLRSSHFFDTLSEDHRLIYTALEYAMENSYCTVYVDSRMAEDWNTLWEILQYLSLDSPFLEQNLKYELGTFTDYLDVSIMDLYDRQAEFSGNYIYVENFSEEMWTKKQKALAKAREVVDSLPEGLSELERADALYRYVTSNITYLNYDEFESGDAEFVKSFLYDGLVEGKTNCDGFANSLSLLWNLAGIENVEKVYGMGEEVEIGHTWNTFCADGIWYNADGTSSATIPPESKVHAGVGFGFPDELQDYNAELSHAYAECTSGAYITVDARLYDTEPAALANAVWAGFESHGGLWALVIVDSYSETQTDEAMQTIANQANGTVYHVTYDCQGGRTAIYVCVGSIIQNE